MMLDVTVTIRGEGGLSINQMLRKYDVNIKKLGPTIIKDLAQRTQKSMVLRAPRDTEALKHSIVVIPRGTNEIEVTAGQGGGQLNRGYATYQGLGFKPHWVSARKHPEVKDWLDRKGYHANKKGLVYIRKFKPFFLETINFYLTPQLITQVTEQHAKEALR